MKSIFKFLFPLAGFNLSFGGDSNSSNETVNKTDVRDMRVVGGNDSANVSATDSTVNVVTSDHGAINGAFQTVDKALQLSTKLVGDNAKQTIEANKNMFEGVLTQSNAAISAVKGAYENSQNPENTQLKIAGFVVVGIVAVSMLVKK